MRILYWSCLSLCFLVACDKKNEEIAEHELMVQLDESECPECDCFENKAVAECELLRQEMPVIEFFDEEVR